MNHNIRRVEHKRRNTLQEKHERNGAKTSKKWFSGLDMGDRKCVRACPLELAGPPHPI